MQGQISAGYSLRFRSAPRTPLCAIHHLAFDRNLLGIDPGGLVHITDRLLREIDGPMLRTGLQGFHGASIALPRRPEDRPDPARLEAGSSSSVASQRKRESTGSLPGR